MQVKVAIAIEVEYPHPMTAGGGLLAQHQLHLPGRSPEGDDGEGPSAPGGI